MDLSTSYLGLKLKNPLVVSAGPLTRSLTGARRLEDAGAGAVVVYSLFEEQINREIHELDMFLWQGTESYAEAVDYLPKPSAFTMEPERYVEHIAAIKEALSIPVIGSLNGVSPGGWLQYARYIEQAGADALELNVYFLPTDPLLPPSEIEEDYLSVLREVKRTVDIPVAVKLAPYFTNVAWLGRKLLKEGADGLVLFNRFYQPDIDLDTLEVVPRVDLSDSSDLRIALRWLAILRSQTDKSLAATGGVHEGTDLIKATLAGADVAMVLASLLRKGPGQIEHILDGATRWLEEHEYTSLGQLRGSMSYANVPQPGVFERANYVKALNAFPTPGFAQDPV